MFQEFLEPGAMTALLQVLMVDLVLAGDNAIVVGMAVAGLPAAIRTRAIFLGIAAAAVLRIIFSLMTVQLLSITGLVLAGGVLLLWVCWKMYREIMEQRAERKAAEAIEEATDDLLSENGHKPAETEVPTKTLRQALIQIILADVSMSLDNVLAVAGAARHHEMIMVIGLAVSVILMAVASTFIARLLSRFHWIAYIGLAMIGYIALKMIYDGSFEVLPLIGVK
ncbi:TerC family protein [Elstera cyanobacteriorum]|nr:TerC family protein [Elstera cyanobacteriorum]GFZ90723.1 membrane protein [Elstera cyanobacteriorum]